MNRSILNILFFFALIAGVDVCIGVIGDFLQTHAKGGGTKQINDFVLVQNHDVIVLGSSRAHHTYDSPYLSDTLALDVYNAGYDGNGVVLAYGLLAMILERYQPRLVLYDVEPAFDMNVYVPDNNHKRYIRLLKPYYRDINVGELIKDVSHEEWYTVHSGLIRYNSSFISMIVDNLKEKSIDEKGYAPLDGVYTQEPEDDNNDEIIDPFKLDYIEKLILLSQSKQVPIVFVASPKYGQVTSESLQPVKAICAQYHVPFIDYYADPEFMQHKELFKEPMHLNRDGARVFSERMIDVMANNMAEDR